MLLSVRLQPEGEDETGEWRWLEVLNLHNFGIETVDAEALKSYVIDATAQAKGLVYLPRG